MDPSLFRSRWILSQRAFSSTATTTSCPRRTAKRWAAMSSEVTSITAEFIRNRDTLREGAAKPARIPIRITT